MILATVGGLWVLRRLGRRLGGDREVVL